MRKFDTRLQGVTAGEFAFLGGPFGYSCSVVQIAAAEKLKTELGNLCLIVDDEPAILRLVSVVLQDMGCETLSAPNAEAAMELLQTAHPDVIITDVRLPGIDGIELTRKIRSDETLSATPVLLMSAYGEPRGHEGDDFLAKPFDIDGLIDFVSRYIGTEPV